MAQRQTLKTFGVRLNDEDREALERTAELAGVAKAELAREALRLGVSIVGRQTEVDRATDLAWSATRLALEQVRDGIEKKTLEVGTQDVARLAKTAKLLSEYAEDGSPGGEVDLREAYLELRVGLLARFGPEFVDELDTGRLIDVAPQ